MIPREKLEIVVDRFEEIEAKMATDLPPDEFVKLSKEYAELTPVVTVIRDYESVTGEINDLTDLVADDETDAEMRDLAREELKDLKERLPGLEDDLRIKLLPKDAADDRNAIVEIRAGTGGDEASLFAADLFRMYHRYADLHGWKVEMMSVSESEVDGYKEVIAGFSGQGVFAHLKYESGVHRVQRVPTTEASGRIHTSAATVAVLPEAEDVDVEVEDKDLRIDVFRASGPGGQSVNTTDSAVRITHLPTGIVVSQQDEKSQHKNKAKALKVLRARLFEQERARIESERAADRKGQVGSGDRSERIRTYNFPQGRVTDHRINLTLYKLDRIISGDELGELIDALIAEDQASRLAAMESAGENAG